PPLVPYTTRVRARHRCEEDACSAIAVIGDLDHPGLSRAAQQHHPTASPHSTTPRCTARCTLRWSKGLENMPPEGGATSARVGFSGETDHSFGYDVRVAGCDP